MDKAAVKNNFSKSARCYDRYATVQRHCASGLISEAARGDFRNILEIGCGTGGYTSLLRKGFPRAAIKAVDISGPVIERAREKLGRAGIDFIVGDAEELDLGGGFDLVTSNASFQWFADLGGTLTKYRGLLVDGGQIIFSVFGPRTYNELKASLDRFLGMDARLGSAGFIEGAEIERMLNSLFNDVRVKEEIYTETSASLKELLVKIKYTGTRGNGLEGTFWTPGRLDALERIYIEEVGTIAATYQIFFCNARERRKMGTSTDSITLCK